MFDWHPARFSMLVSFIGSASNLPVNDTAIRVYNVLDLMLKNVYFITLLNRGVVLPCMYASADNNQHALFFRQQNYRNIAIGISAAAFEYL